MDTGDVVHHKPTGETWTVAYVKDEYLSWCGWPEGQARVVDCELMEAATPEKRHGLLLAMAAMEGSDSRKTYAIHRLRNAESVLPKEY